MPLQTSKSRRGEAGTGAAPSAVGCSFLGLLALAIFTGSFSLTALCSYMDCTGAGMRASRRLTPAIASAAVAAPSDGRAAVDTLVIYVFSNTDPEYINNLRFFMREGVQEGDHCEYIFVVNVESASEADMTRIGLPKLRGNSRYVVHGNECYDWGTFGWVLESQRVDVAKYKNFIFLNSSIRGPFIPAYLKGRVHWTEMLLNKLSDTVKLVGPTISCEGVAKTINGTRVWRANPHVQSYAVATDAAGMRVLLRDGRVFDCYDNMDDTRFYSELGSSKAILDAGFSIDSLMVRYQSIDWRNKRNWDCNAGINPCGHYCNDGSSLEAMEVMFVKVKAHQLEAKWPYMLAASHFDKWYLGAAQNRSDVRKNDFAVNMKRYALPAALAARRRGIRCFDCAYYKQKNGDLPSNWLCIQFFEHYLNDGVVEGRYARYTCNFDANKFFPLHFKTPPEDRQIALS